MFIKRAGNFLVGVVLSCSSVAIGQTKFGPAIGLGMTNYSLKYGTTRVSHKGERLSLDPRLGVAFSTLIKGRFDLQSGLLFASYGYRWSYPNSPSRIRFSVHSFELPLSLSYRTGHENAHFAIFSAGVYYGLNVGGKSNYQLVDIHGNAASTVEQKIRYGDDTLSDYRRGTFGITANIGYQITEAFQMRVHYQRGIRNMEPTIASATQSTVISSAGIIFCYLFRLNRDKSLIAED
jgi:hypothetical protein